MKRFDQHLRRLFFFIAATVCANGVIAQQGDANPAPIAWHVHHQSEPQDQHNGKYFVLEGFCEQGWKLRGPSISALTNPGSGNSTSFGALQLTLVPTATPAPAVAKAAKDELKIDWPTTETLSSPLMPDEAWQGYQGTVQIPLRVPRTPQSQLRVEGVACSSTECRPFRHTFDLAALAAAPENVVPENVPAAIPAATKGALPLLLLAFVGGAILNLMPCVLPVLALKIVSYVSARGHTRPKRSFFLTTLGILTSFLVLALLTAGLRQTGQFMGWGLHFQHPGFLLFMTLLTLGFACNLMGFFEWALPRRLQNFLDDLFQKPSASGIKDFLSGAFATLLATPCTAPFLGIAMGYAVSQSFVSIVIFFFVAGLGFALPYLVLMILPVAWIPHPKPGAWMNHLRRALGFALLGTSLWLGMVFWSVLQTPDLNEDLSQNTSETQLTDQIAQHVREGRVVLVNVTAAWCLTCQVNKRVAFRNLDTWIKQSHGKLVFIERDWTRPNPKIEAFLAQHRRAGIPLTVVYGRLNPQGRVLSELLSESEIQQAIQDSGLANANQGP